MIHNFKDLMLRLSENYWKLENGKRDFGHRVFKTKNIDKSRHACFSALYCQIKSTRFDRAKLKYNLRWLYY